MDENERRYEIANYPKDGPWIKLVQVVHTFEKQVLSKSTKSRGRNIGLMTPPQIS